LAKGIIELKGGEEMSNDTAQKKKEEKYELNPLSWGMLFFTFWLTLIVLPLKVTIGQIILAWFCFGLSVLLLTAIYVPWLRKQYKKPSIRGMVLPIVFDITMASFIIGLATSLTGTKGVIRYIVVYIGFIWVVTYLLILVRASIKGIGILASVAFFGYGIYLMAQANDESHMISGIVSTLIGIVMGYISIKRPKWLWHESLI
jgi:hypothetical protein